MKYIYVDWSWYSLYIAIYSFYERFFLSIIQSISCGIRIFIFYVFSWNIHFSIIFFYYIFLLYLSFTSFFYIFLLYLLFHLSFTSFFNIFLLYLSIIYFQLFLDGGKNLWRILKHLVIKKEFNTFCHVDLIFLSPIIVMEKWIVTMMNISKKCG